MISKWWSESVVIKVLFLRIQYIVLMLLRFWNTNTFQFLNLLLDVQVMEAPPLRYCKPISSQLSMAFFYKPKTKVTIMNNPFISHYQKNHICCLLICQWGKSWVFSVNPWSPLSLTPCHTALPRRKRKTHQWLDSIWGLRR